MKKKREQRPPQCRWELIERTHLQRGWLELGWEPPVKRARPLMEIQRPPGFRLRFNQLATPCRTWQTLFSLYLIYHRRPGISNLNCASATISAPGRRPSKIAARIRPSREGGRKPCRTRRLESQMGDTDVTVPHMRTWQQFMPLLRPFALSPHSWPFVHSNQHYSRRETQPDL
jgi:hypothetical protein